MVFGIHVHSTSPDRALPELAGAPKPSIPPRTGSTSCSFASLFPWRASDGTRRVQGHGQLYSTFKIHPRALDLAVKWLKLRSQSYRRTCHPINASRYNKRAIGLSLRSRNEMHPQKLFLGSILGCSRIFGWPASDSSIRLPPKLG
jgi:hypothetical protein